MERVRVDRYVEAQPQLVVLPGPTQELLLRLNELALAPKQQESDQKAKEEQNQVLSKEFNVAVEKLQAAIGKTKALLNFVEFTHISEHYRSGDAPPGKYIAAKALNKETHTRESPRDRIACKRQVIIEMAALLQSARTQMREKVDAQRRYISALLDLRKTWNLSREKSELVLYLGNERYSSTANETRIPLSLAGELSYEIPASVREGSVLIVTIEPCAAFVETDFHPFVEKSDLEVADMCCRDKAVFADLLREARTCEEFAVRSKSPKGLTVDVCTKEFCLQGRVRFQWESYAGKESAAKRLLIDMWQKQRENDERAILLPYIRLVAHSYVVQLALKTLTEALVPFPMNFFPSLQKAVKDYTEFAVFNGVRRVIILVIEGTEIRIGFASRVLLKIGEMTFSGLQPGAMRPIAAAELKKAVQMSLATYERELFSS